MKTNLLSQFIKQVSMIYCLISISVFQTFAQNHPVAQWEDVSMMPGVVSNVPNTIHMSYGMDMYVATTYNAMGSSIFISQDGLVWEQDSNKVFPLNNNWVGGFIYVDDYFYATVGSVFYKSSDLENWTNIGTQGLFNGNGLRYLNGVFFHPAPNGLAMSSDTGQTWTTILDDAEYMDIAYGNGKFVAVGRASAKGVMHVSNDGATWTNIYDVDDDLDMFYSIDYHDGKFMLSGNNGMIGESSDGENWTFSTPTGATQTLMSIRRILGAWVTNSTFQVYYSLDNGANWTEASVSGSVGQFKTVVELNGFGFIPGNNAHFIKTTDQATSITNLEELSTINLYPNPASTQITLDNLKTGSAINIYDALGKLVYHNINHINERFTLDVSHFNEGVYFIQISNNIHSTETKKLIVSK